MQDLFSDHDHVPPIIIGLSYIQTQAMTGQLTLSPQKGEKKHERIVATARNSVRAAAGGGVRSRNLPAFPLRKAP
jgi:copper homeostasis protein CutC